jgi:uncharacterized membrane protein (DUF4010 family)
VTETALALLVAALGGAAVGVERQWSGHATGPLARFAGVRTFTLIGLLGGLSGQIWQWDVDALAIVLLVAGAALVVSAYVMSSRQDVEATTEVAALVVLASGVSAGLGFAEVASGVIAVTVVLLVEKSRLHAFVARFEDVGLFAAARFAVMAVVILPVLPEGPFGPLGGVRPRELWMLVLFFSGLSYAGYLARAVVGDRHGYPLAGLLGGLVSSTNVTLTFARLSRDERANHLALAQGAVAANAVLFLRAIVATSVLSPALSVALTPVFLVPFFIGAAAVLMRWRTSERAHAGSAVQKNPLDLASALQMTVLFQAVLFLFAAADRWLGEAGVLGTAAMLGLTDVDALTMTMARGVSAGSTPASLAVQAIGVGVLANTVVKIVLATAIGRGAFRAITLGGLLSMGAALVTMLWVRT